MNRRDVNFTIGVCLSLSLHLGFMTYSAYRYAHQNGHLYLAPIWNRENSVIVRLVDPKDLAVHDELGERNGKGIGSNAAEGEQPLRAPEADEDQASLTRNPSAPLTAVTPVPLPEPAAAPTVAANAPSSVDPIPPTPFLPAPAKNSPLAPSPMAVAIVQTPAPSLVVPMPDITLPTPAPAINPAPLAQPKQPRPDPIAVATAAAMPVPATPARSATPVDLRPAARASMPIGATSSDSESDAFSKIGSAVFRNGKLETRMGRKVITRSRPQILVPGLLDTFGLANPTVVLKINIDSTGNVSNVNIFRSSGSNDLDQPCLRAVYDWWFEPARDTQGKAIPDAVEFSITFR